MVRAPESAAANAYRAALRGLQASVKNGTQGRYLVVAVDRSVDADLATANLAVAASASGLCTLVVDTDVRHHRLQKLLGREPVPGTASAEPLAQPPPPLQGTRFPGLALFSPDVPTGSGPDLLATPQFGEALHTAAAGVDLMLVSCGVPLLDRPDALLIARWVSNAILVMKANKTRRDDAVRAKMHLERAGARIAGVALVW